MANGLIGKVTAGGGTHLIASTAYFTCATAGGTAAKIAKAADTSLNSLTVITGMTIYVKFDAANTKANPTLTLQTNGGTELLAAKPIMRYGTTATHTNAAGSWKSGAIVALTYDGTNWVEVSSLDDDSTYTITSVWCNTAADTAAKVSSNASYYALRQYSHFELTLRYANTAQSALTLNVANTGAKPIYINGTASSASNYTLPAGKYLVYYDGTNYYFRTDNYITGNITGAASKATSDADGNTISSTYVKKAGDTMTGALDINKTASNVSLAIDASTLKIGSTRYDLNFNINNGSGSGINNGYASAITWGKDAATYAGIYYQSSSSYGSRLIFGTTNSYSNGAYARMIILQNGRVGIGTLEPSTMLDVDGTGKFKGISSTNAINIEHSNSAKLTAKDTTSTGEVFYGFGSAHQNHGIYSYGYAPTATTWTTDEKWMVCRDSTGKITLNGNAATATKLETTRTLTIGSSGKTFDGSADVSWTLDDIGAVSTSGGTMTGGLTLSNGSSAYNDKGIIFTNGSRIGENGGGDLGIYAADGLYIKPSSPTASSSTEGIRITSNGLYPCVNNTELLGLSDNKWSNVYATTFTGNLNGASNANIYLTSATAAGTAAKTASYTGFSLLTGSSIYIKFNKTNTAESPTLNIEGTGAKEIWYKGAIVKYQGIATGITYHMMYDGSKWQIINNIIPQMGTCSTNAGTTPKTATCPGFILHTGATIKIKFTKTNTVLAPALNINNTGAKPINWIGATDDLAHRLLEDHIYEFVYDGTNYNIVAPIARHYATSGAAPVMYTQQDYDNYVDLHGGPPTWAVGDTKTEAVNGIETLALGNSTDYHSAGGLRGRIILYGTGSTDYTTIYAQANGTNSVYLPNYNGAMHLIHAGNNNAVGTSSKPVYVAANGRVTQGSTYAGGTAVTLNGTSKGASTASFYAPTAAGTANQVLKSTAGTPEWTTVASVSNEVLTIVS